jgi:hypothetical protein
MLSDPAKYDNGIAACNLVESRNPAGHDDQFRTEMGGSEDITTDFIRASVQECRD